jgi:hypothetical protein
MLLLTTISGLYYKYITIVKDDSSDINKWQVSLTDDTRVDIYDRNMFIIQATGFDNPLAGNTKGGSTTVQLTSCLTSLD